MTTIEILNNLKASGLADKQAEAIVDAIEQKREDFVRKADLEAAIERLKSELQRFVFVTVVLTAVAQLVVAKIWH
jgi:outer membrane protein assembly factor BamA